MMLAKLKSFLSFHLLGYQTSIGQRENITDENLSKKEQNNDKI